jgi:hypothetical protein
MPKPELRRPANLRCGILCPFDVVRCRDSRSQSPRWEGSRRRSFALLFLVSIGLAVPARADTCTWVNSVTTWDASIGWSWSEGNYGWTEPPDRYDSTAQDAGSASGVLAEGYYTTGVRLAAGAMTGGLSFLDRLDITPKSGSPGFSQYTADGPIIGSFDPLASLDLYLDTLGCTYHWEFQPKAAGAFSTPSGSIPIQSLDVNSIQTVDRPIPSAPAPLVFDGPVPASAQYDRSPEFLTFAQGAYRAETNVYAPQTPLPDAFLHWIFTPGNSVAPPNDECAGAGALLFGSLASQSEDVSFATSASTDPASACGAGDRSVWFFFVPPTSGMAQISTAGSGYSTLVSVWQVVQTCAALTTEVGCGAIGASIPVQAGVPLYVQVQRSGSGGTGNLDIAVTPEPSAALVAGVACAGLGCVARVRRGAARPA